MYHEEDYEMEQLLRSIHDVDMNSGKTGHQFEAHVFFDGCVRVEVLNSYALKLASVVETTLMVRLTDCKKMKTPYGMQLKWRLSGGMEFIIHLKDNAKVREQNSMLSVSLTKNFLLNKVSQTKRNGSCDNPRTLISILVCAGKASSLKATSLGRLRFCREKHGV